MKEIIYKSILDNKGDVSFLRLISIPVVIVACLGFAFSIYFKYNEGLTAASALLALVYGAKSFQKKVEGN